MEILHPRVCLLDLFFSHLSCYQLQSSNCQAKTLESSATSFSLIFYILSYYEALLVTAWKYVQSLVTSHICLSPVHPLPPVWAPTAASSAVICLQTLPLRQSVLHTAPRNPLKCEADPVTPLLKSLSVYPLHSE